MMRTCCESTGLWVVDSFAEGKVQSGVSHAQRTSLKGKRFEGLEKAQAYLDRWEQTVPIQNPWHSKRQVAAMFAEEKPALLPLPWNRSQLDLAKGCSPGSCLPFN